MIPVFIRGIAVTESSHSSCKSRTQQPSGRFGGDRRETQHMLAEKFILVLETLLSRAPPDGSTRVVSTSQQVPIEARAPTPERRVVGARAALI
jgi:hypothetical protein